MFDERVVLLKDGVKPLLLIFHYQHYPNTSSSFLFFTFRILFSAILFQYYYNYFSSGCFFSFHKRKTTTHFFIQSQKLFKLCKICKSLFLFLSLIFYYYDVLLLFFSIKMWTLIWFCFMESVSDLEFSRLGYFGVFFSSVFDET